MKNTIVIAAISGLFIFYGLSMVHTPNLSAASSTTISKNEKLLETIQSFAHDNDIQPIDALIDRVWKAVPGYNVLVVDIEASYKRMVKSDEFNEDLLVYNEIAPSVRLSDLPPSPIYKGNPQKPMVAFLINVAWGDEFIPPILKTLREHNVKTTFFFDGSWTKKSPELAKMILDEGHEIGNHAYSHPDLGRSSEAKTREELTKTNNVIEEMLGVKPKWFGPPSGSFNQRTVEIARELDMFTVLWTVDTVDWKLPEASAMVNRVVSKVENGSMVLMHPTKPTAEGLEKMIADIKQKGYVIGTVSELLSEDRINTNLQEDLFN